MANELSLSRSSSRATLSKDRSPSSVPQTTNRCFVPGCNLQRQIDGLPMTVYKNKPGGAGPRGKMGCGRDARWL